LGLVWEEKTGLKSAFVEVPPARSPWE